MQHKNTRQELEKLLNEAQEALQAKEEEFEALKKEALQIKADFVNFQNRVTRDKERDRKLAAQSAVELLLPVLDNLERTTKACPQDENSIDPLSKGILMIERQFLTALEALGLSKIEAQGNFDPNLHEAVAVCPTEEADKDGAILEELQCGYILGGKVVRPCKVVVAKLI